jgi:hypothetical protein
VNTPAGWHPDPMGRHQFRYWNGLAWTDSVADDGQQSADPLSQAPQQWVAPQYSGICESCQAQSSSGKRVTFFAAQKGDTGREGIYLKTSYTFLARSYVFLCGRCAKSSSKVNAAIVRKMAATTPGATKSFDFADFLTKFALELVREPGYVRIRDVMRDDLAPDETAGDATLVFGWEGKSFFNDLAQGFWVDDYCDGVGSATKGWKTQVRVPPGIHKLSFLVVRGREVFLNAESGATYDIDITYSRMSGRSAFEVTHNRPSV